MKRPRLKQTAELFRLADGQVHVLRPSADSDIVLGDLSPQAQDVLERLDGRSTVAELHEGFGPALVGELIAGLSDVGLLDDAAEDDEIPPEHRERYDRQLRYFADLAVAPETAASHQSRVSSSRVVVLGLGGLGSWTAYALACCGIGELVLVDGDRVESSNLNRQILYREEELGAPKAPVAAAALRAFNSDIHVEAHAERLASKADIARAIDGASVLVDAADWPAHDIERWVDTACFEAGIPYITMSHFPPVARVGPLYVPGETGCFHCQEEAYRRAYPLYDAIIEQRRARPSPAATLGPVCAFVGGQVALDVVHYLTGLCRPASLGVSRIVDLRTLDVSSEHVPRRQGCPICGDHYEKP